MKHEFDVEALGLVLRVEVGGMSDADFRRLRGQWRRTWSSGMPSARISAVLGEHSPDAEVAGREFDELSVRLRQTINLRAVGAAREELLMFHAAGLADPATGDVIALIGPSGAGKTTAASSLGTVLGYVSDETVAVDVTGAVRPFPKPLAVKQGGPGARKRIAGPDALGLVEVRAPLRLSRIALLERVEQPVAAVVTTVPPGEVLDSIVEQTNYFAALPRALGRLEVLVRACGGVHVIRYHEAADLLEPVSALLRLPNAQLSPTEVAMIGPTGCGAQVDPMLPAGAYARARVQDWIELDGDVVAMVNGRVHRLSPLGSLLWRALQAPQRVDELAARCEAVFGPAPSGDTRAAISAVLEELARVGIVVSPHDRPVVFGRKAG